MKHETVPKRDGQVRICRNYKVTINPVLDVDKYPLPRPEDLFATLAGGRYFSTLDLLMHITRLMMHKSFSPLTLTADLSVTQDSHLGLLRHLWCSKRPWIPFFKVWMALSVT